jgi:thiol-disulfide isomerase/thioredoxin
VVAGLLSTGLPAAAQSGVLRGLDGRDLRPADLAQGTTVLVLWASRSPRCRDIAERISALERRWGGGAQVVAVAFNEDRVEVEKFLAGKRLGARVVLDADGAFAKKHAITWLPGLVVIKSGETAYAGKLPDDPDALLARLLG